MSNNFAKIGGGLNLGSLGSDPINGNPGDFYYNTTFNKVRFFNGTVWKNVGSGSGSGSGVGINFTNNGDFEDGIVTPFVTYGNTPGSQPVNGSGGSPVSTLSVNSSNPLSGIYDGLFSKDNNNRQGEGFSIDVTIDNARNGQILEVDFDYKVGGGFATGPSSDLQVFIYDVTGSTLIPIDNPFIESAGVSHFRARFRATSSGLIYRLIFHIATSNTSAWTFEVDNVYLGTVQVQAVSSNADRQILDMISGGSGTVGSGTQFGTLTFTAKATARYKIIGEVGLGPNGGQNPYCQILEVSGNPVGNTQSNPQFAFAGSSPYRQSTNTFWYGDLTAGYTYQFNLQVYNFGGGLIVQDSRIWGEQIGPDQSPIGYSSKVYASQLISSGTRVTTTPSKIGEWRSQLRNGGGVTYTDTNGNPTIQPTVADGIAIYGNTSWGGSDPNNQPSRYEIFIGFNKVFRSIFYNGAARFKPVDGRPIQLATAAAQGHVEAYDPLTGVYSVAGYWGQFGTEATHYGGQDTASGSVATPFFDAFQHIGILSLEFHVDKLSRPLL